MFEQVFKNVDDVLWKGAGCTTELDYTEQTSWILFLKYLDALEDDRKTEAELQGKKYAYLLEKPYRWESWAAPKSKDGKIDQNKALTDESLGLGGVLKKLVDHGLVGLLTAARETTKAREQSRIDTDRDELFCVG
jgi:hypothetical protein